MEAGMRLLKGAWRRGPIVAGCLLLALQANLAQNAAKSSGTPHGSAAQSVLVDKAHALESRGRPDMAMQEWQQILLADPKNLEALAGVARDLKIMGSDKAGEALGKLRAANPSDPNIARIQALPSTHVENQQLGKAGELSRQGRVDEAMGVYRQLYGNHPPDGDIALAYYQTLYGTATGKDAAIAGMRGLVQRNPADARFAIELGTMLTYNQRTRAEGIRILKEHAKDATAQSALRQALIWDAANPASAAELRAYLKEHPQDKELESQLAKDEVKLAQMNNGIARTAAERAAFDALNRHKLDEAEKRFTDLLAADPQNGRMAAGMGFLRMQQNNFGAALGFLNQAKQDGYTSKAVDDALAASQFWYTMAQASQALTDNQLDVAEAKYRAALGLRANSPEALMGLAGLMVKAQHYGAAAELYEALVKAQPGSTEAWRGLFLAYARESKNERALVASGRFPGAVRAALTRDPEYLRTLATIYRAEGRNADAQRVLTEALALPFPDNGSSLRADVRLEMAGVLMEAKRYDQAAALYAQLLEADSTNQSAWAGLVNAHHLLGQDTRAIGDVEKMPPAVYEIALSDPAFLSVLAAIYQQANQFEIAQGMLERAAKLESAHGGSLSLDLQLQLAGIYLERNDTAKAYEIYQAALKDHADRADAWKGLIAALMATNRNSEALQEIAVIPAAVRKQMEGDIEFVQTEASLYAAAGETARALELMTRVEAHYAKLKQEPPANIDIQNAWLLFNTRNDRQLYPALMRLGSRTDLTVAQRETVQDIWANWSVRRAAIAMENGNVTRAVEILEAASQAFPDNVTVRKAVAGGFVQVGRAKESLALYRTVEFQDATSGDFQGAIGAALAANDKAQAELWLRQALDRYPKDPAILSLGARFEQARGDNERAAGYYRAALAAMPSVSPTERLAHILVYPEQDTKAHRAVTAADLQQLLDPNNEPFAKTTKLPPLPKYGHDPYDGSAPVQPAEKQKTPSSLTNGTETPIFQQQSLTKIVGRSERVGGVGLGRSRLRCVKQGTVPTGLAILVGSGFPTLKRGANQHCAYGAFRSSRVGNDGGGLTEARDATATGMMLRMVMASHPSHKGFKKQVLRLRCAPLRMTVARVGHPELVEASVRASRGTRWRMGPAIHASMISAEPLAQAPGLTPEPQLSANAPHSMASDAWKGLIFSLMAGGKNAEAIAELANIPPDVRQQLEADVEFVQGEASLFIAVGDIGRATQTLNRVESFYLLRRSAPPGGLEVQHAWLLYNAGDERSLYPVLQRLDARTDLTSDQRGQVETIWANWAVKRAEIDLNSGHLAQGLQLLQAASQSYPESLAVRRAVAGAYAKVGRWTDALGLFKTIPMDDAGPQEYEAAISAALGATDMIQAEAWLRQALAKFPGDAGVLAEAARFEQARGNAQRAADFWRASLAALPAGSAQRLDTVLTTQGGASLPANGDVKQLLDPKNRPETVNRVPPLPGYRPNSQVKASAETSSGLSATQQQAGPRQNQWLNSPSGDPLPLPAGTPTRSPGTGQVPNGQTPPVYVPQSSLGTKKPVLVEESYQQGQQTANTEAPNGSGSSRVQVHVQGQPGTGAQASPKDSNSQYMGKMNLPPAEQDVGTTDGVGHSGAAGTGEQASGQGVSGQAGPARNVAAAKDATPPVSLRISSRPMGAMAAQVQALMAEQTDNQLTQGSAATIHGVPNAAAGNASAANGSSSGTPSGTLIAAQYTPSAQEAATGAYSAPKQQAASQTGATPAQAKPSAAAKKKTRLSGKARKKAAKRAQGAPTQSAPTLSNAPTTEAQLPDGSGTQQQGSQQPGTQGLPDAPAPATADSTAGTGLTDEELQERNLPPLRGPWVRTQRQAQPLSPRDEAEMQLRGIEASYSPYLGGDGIVNYRTGALGYDHLAALEAPFEASMPLGFNARVTVIAKPVFLDSGQADGTSVITVQKSTTGGSTLVSIPQPIGTLVNTDTTLPAQQNAAGLGGEVQMAFPHLVVAGGYTPFNFLVSTFTARAQWKPGNGPFTISVNRDPVKDTQLSYAGLRDPAGTTLGTEGQIWGGVIANQGNVQFSKGDAESGFYVSAGGQYLRGYKVETNTRIDGGGGAYWRIKTTPEYGNLSVGVNFFAMHYQHNEDAFTLGMGGYFSPSAYFLANVPFTWTGHYGTKWHYDVLGSLGVQAFQEDRTPLWPLAGDKSIETFQSNPMLPAKTSVGSNYDVRSHVSYQIGPHWFAGGFVGANNSRNYTSISAGFSIHYMFRAQPSTVAGPTGLFPTDGVRPFTVP
jgi:tetratricopeptide (TPR) repeat protein